MASGLDYDLDAGTIEEPQELGTAYLDDAILVQISGLTYSGGTLYAVAVLDVGEDEESVTLFKIGPEHH